MANILLGGSISTTGTSILGSQAVSFPSDANYTLSVTEYTNQFLSVSSNVTLTTTRNLIAPLVKGQTFIVQNNTTGSQSIQIIGNSGTGIIIPNGGTTSVVCDGTNYLVMSGGSTNLSGDVTGTTSNSVVARLQTYPISSVAPLDGYVLTWDNTDGYWHPAPTASSSPIGAASGDLSGTYPSPTVIALQGHAVSATIPTGNQVLEWNGSAWAPANLPSSLPPSGSAGGDLSGTYPNPTVAKLQGYSVNGVVPTDGYVLTWDNADGYWKPEPIPTGPSSLPPNGPAGGDLSGTYPNPTVSAIQGHAVSSTVPTINQILEWSGSAWTPTNLPSSLPPSGSASGDLGGSYPSPTVIAIQGRAISSTAPLDGYVLEWSALNNQWGPAALPQSLPPTGSASGDLGGTYPSPSVVKIQGNSISSVAPNNGDVLEWNSTSVQWEPTALPSSLPPTGSAGGDLAGAYPNPSVVALRGYAVAATAPTDTYVLTWSATNNYWYPAAATGGGGGGAGQSALYSGTQSAPGTQFTLTSGGTAFPLSFGFSYYVSMDVIITNAADNNGPATFSYKVSIQGPAGPTTFDGILDAFLVHSNTAGTPWNVQFQISRGATPFFSIIIDPGVDATNTLSAQAYVSWAVSQGSANTSAP